MPRIFHNSKIDVFNSSFAKQTTSASSFAFTDPAHTGRLCAVWHPSH